MAQGFSPVKSRLADRTKVLYHSGSGFETISAYVATCGLLSVILATAVLSLVGVAIVIAVLVGFGPIQGATITYSGLKLFICGVTGLIVTGLIVWITEY